jgi:predicted HTH domain antitoxin
VQDELEKWRRWMEMTVGRFAASSSLANPVHSEDLIEKLAECRAKLYEGVDPALEDEAFTPEDLLNAMLPVAEWLTEGGNDVARFVFAALIFERGWLSSGKAARLAGLDRVIFLTNLHRVGIAVLDLDEDELENQASYVNAE